MRGPSKTVRNYAGGINRRAGPCELAYSFITFFFSLTNLPSSNIFPLVPQIVAQENFPINPIFPFSHSYAKL